MNFLEPFLSPSIFFDHLLRRRAQGSYHHLYTVVCCAPPPASMSAAEKAALIFSDANLAAKMQSREDAEGAIAIAAAEAAVASDADVALAERLREQLDAADASAERDSAGDVTMTADDLGGGVTRGNGVDRGATGASNPTPASGADRSSGTTGAPEPQPLADARATVGGGSRRRSPRVAASSVLHIDGAAAAILRGSTTAWAALNVQARHGKQKLVVRFALLEHDVSGRGRRAIDSPRVSRRLSPLFRVWL